MGKLGRDPNSQQSGTGLWCWIKLNYRNKRILPSDILLMFLSGKLWEILTYILSFSVYMSLKVTTYLEVRISKQHICSCFIYMYYISLKIMQKKGCNVIFAAHFKFCVAYLMKWMQNGVSWNQSFPLKRGATKF